MLEGHHISGVRCEFAADLAAPRAVLEGLALPRGLLHWRDVRPGLVVTRTVSMMQRIEHAQSGLARGVQDLHHMRDAVVGFSDRLHAIPKLASLGDEIVVRVDHEKRGDRLLGRQCAHETSLSWLTASTV